MEQRPFKLKERPFGQKAVKALPFIVAWMIGAPLLAITAARFLPPLVTILLVFGFFILLIFLHVRSEVPSTEALLSSPCPECGAAPMKFDRGSTGDYVFTCTKCQIEWTLGKSALRT
jgi:hypothetical protein